MMNSKLYIWLLGLLFVSCYDDLGNYDYTDVNEVGITLKSSYGVKREYQTFVIRPEIIQSQRDNYSNLEFLWTENTKSDQYRGDTLSIADSVALLIDPASKDFSDQYYLRLYVTDKTTRATQMFPTTVKVTKPYEGAWMILHSQENSTRLGAIEYLSGDITITNDAFYKETGRRLRGTASRLGYCTYFDGAGMNPRPYRPVTQFWCFTSDPNESGVLIQSDHFRQYDSISRCVYPAHLDDFDCADVRVLDGVDKGPVCVTKGNVFHGTMNTCKLYKMSPQDGIDPANPAVQGDIQVTHGTASGWSSLVYDSKGHRFLHTYSVGFNTDPHSFNDGAENGYRMQYVRKMPDNVSPEIADPDNIGEDKEMVYMGAGYWYGPNLSMPSSRTAIYAFAKSKVTNESYVYEFHSTPLWNAWREPETSDFTGFFKIKTPEGLTTETPMACSGAFNRLLFYAIGNKVYRMDFSVQGGSSILIYEHPDADAKATVMKMARQYARSIAPEHEHYGHVLARSLAVAFDISDGTGEVVVLNLTFSGKVDVDGTYPAIQRHSADQQGKKFGKVKDLVFI